MEQAFVGGGDRHKPARQAGATVTADAKSALTGGKAGSRGQRPQTKFIPR
ncbi:MAG: hypothetical protein MPL62_00615 [Alphaproteobacteria bacterium]|nr:hypothetical protein [Alphaproteobacteria bacterium]